MTKLEEQCYLAGYYGKKRPPWVANYMEGLVMAYKAGKADRKKRLPLTFNNNLNYLNVMKEKEDLHKKLETDEN